MGSPRAPGEVTCNVQSLQSNSPAESGRSCRGWRPEPSFGQRKRWPHGLGAPKAAGSKPLWNDEMLDYGQDLKFALEGVFLMCYSWEMQKPTILGGKSQSIYYEAAGVFMYVYISLYRDFTT